jgi:flagellar biosynthesis chaperone FliJ/mRNA-degrading endonuclease YafQ of YafQ-DinJ toxin-antitoxin module
MAQIQIFTGGIKKTLRKFSHLQAISEYIWNGFDAQASCVEVSFILNELNGIVGLLICDNGYGIPKDKLSHKFVPFFESEKYIDPTKQRTKSNIHGKNGIGRLTFYHFALQAEWETVYTQDNERLKYSIKMNADSLNSYTESEVEKTQDFTGTCVKFYGIIPELISKEKLIEYLKTEFAWFLELHKDRSFEIKVDGKTLDYATLIVDRESFELVSPAQCIFSVDFIQWNCKLNDEFSRYYFLDSESNEKGSMTTSLNNKGDYFYHSVYIKSGYFDGVNTSIQEDDEGSLFNESSTEVKYFIKEINNFLRKKRKPFLKQYADKLITDFEANKAFPDYNLKNPWERVRKCELEKLVRELYAVEPKIFAQQNVTQKKTFVRLLDLIMDAGEMDKLFDILGEIVELDTSEREELANQLKKTKLSNVIKTIKLIEDRYKAVQGLKALVFNKELKANERDHVQKYIENHYWLFGEQYHLVTAAEPKFEEALKRYNYLLHGEKKDVHIEHPDKNKEMDIFAVRQDKTNDTITNIVVELKHPKIELGMKEYNQVTTYLNVIMSEPQFNASNMNWEFYLVGNDFDNSNFIANHLENAKIHGERSLIMKIPGAKFYVKKWSEIFTEFELKHEFLNQKLQLEREKLICSANSADEIVSSSRQNSAVQPGQVVV